MPGLQPPAVATFVWRWHMENLPRFIIRLYHPGDFNAALSVIQAAELADALPQRITADELRARLSTPHADARLNPADDCWVASVREAGAVAYADGWLIGEGTCRTYRVECFIHPDYRRRGIGRALLTRQWQRARAIARRLSTPESPLSVTLEARAWEGQAGAITLLEGSRFERVRVYYQMQHDLATPLPSAAVPAGLRLEPWIDWRADDAVWRAYEEAFADHWGRTAEPFDRFMRRTQLGHVQRAHSFIAWAGNVVVGASLNDLVTDQGEPRTGNQGWIDTLFVRSAWRGRGLGRALLAASLARAQQLGYTSAALNVDAENLSGAVRLYEGVGYHVVARRFTYRRREVGGER